MSNYTWISLIPMRLGYGVHPQIPCWINPMQGRAAGGIPCLSLITSSRLSWMVLCLWIIRAWWCESQIWRRPPAAAASIWLWHRLRVKLWQCNNYVLSTSNLKISSCSCSCSCSVQFPVPQSQLSFSFLQAQSSSRPVSCTIASMRSPTHFPNS